MDRLTYKRAGVDIAAGNEAVRRIAPLARATFRPEVLGEIGGFANFVRLPDGYGDPVLVASTDGVGTKLKVAFLADRHDTVGIDLVAMGVNDLLVHGAEPLFFLDYVAMGQVVPEKIEAIVRGIAEGCRRAGCALIGGETAEMPDFYQPGEYDLAGFAVGVAERDQIIDGSTIRPGDRLLGLASSGLHSNGYSLARRVIFERLGLKVTDHLEACGRSLAEELLEPTRIYVKPILALLKEHPVKGMAHITGGGISENLPRVLPGGCRARIRLESWPVPPIFSLIQKGGAIDDVEMLRTFNMGVGMILVVEAGVAPAIRERLGALGEIAWEIGEVMAGEGGVRYE